MKISAKRMALLCGHSNEDSATELSHTDSGDDIITLRICGVGDDSFYELINDFGDPMGDVFDDIDIIPNFG